MTENKIDELRREYQDLCRFIFDMWNNDSVSHEALANAEDKAEKVLVLINALEIIDSK